MHGISRRQFLKLAGIAGVITVPVALGYRWFADDSENLPPTQSPYVTDPSWSTTTPAPILLAINERSDNPFGAYLAEILRAEGLNCFRTIRLSALDAATLGTFAIVLLSDGVLTRAESEMFSAYVAGGGKLIAMRPEASALFGIESMSGTAASSNIKIESRFAGLVNSPLQIHASAKIYRTAGAQIVAWLTNESGTQTDSPAVTLHRFGKGQAAAWSFDLARSIAYARQGNPAWANQERDGREGIRAVDAFVDWIDLNRIQIPQADEQMRLLSRLIGVMLADTMPLPRLWYLPNGADCLLIVTGDAHQAPGEIIEQVLLRVERYGGRMSVYYTPALWSGWRRAVFKAGGADALALVGGRWIEPTPTQVAQWRARGHEFGFHPYVEEGLESGYCRYWQEFVAHGYQPVSPTVRTHRILWTGWVETARAQAQLGLRMNLDFYHYGTAFRRTSGDWAYGYFSGTGLPMKFIDEQGRILNIYQQATQLVDEHFFKMTWGGGWANLNGESAIAISKEIIDASLRGATAAVGMQSHIDPFAAGGEFATNAMTWLDGTLAYAAAKNVPIWSAERWANFSDLRHDAAFENVHWDSTARQLSIRLSSHGAQDATMDVMIPSQFNHTRVTQLQVDGQTATPRVRKIGTEEFVCVAVPVGSRSIIATFG